VGGGGGGAVVVVGAGAMVVVGTAATVVKTGEAVVMNGAAVATGSLMGVSVNPVIMSSEGFTVVTEITVVGEARVVVVCSTCCGGAERQPAAISRGTKKDFIILFWTWKIVQIQNLHSASRVSGAASITGISV